LTAPSINLKDGSWELFEYSFQAAAVLAQSILRSVTALDLALVDGVVRVFPGSGKRQLAWHLNHLPPASPENIVSLDTLNTCVRLFPSCVIISSALCAPAIFLPCPAARQGYQLLVVSPDP